MAERPEDLNLPNSVIARVIKEALPENVNVSKDARLAISKAASVFVLYATSCANNFAMNHKRKTITPQDVLDAMKEMEFERFTETLQKSLQAYKEEQKNKKASSQAKKKEKEDTKDSENTEGTENSENVENTEEGDRVEDVVEEEVLISDDEEGGGEN